jgi:hypothetical protein
MQFTNAMQVRVLGKSKAIRHISFTIIAAEIHEKKFVL